MPKPRVKLVKSPCIVATGPNEDWNVSVLGLVSSYDSIKDHWFVFAIRARCQAPGCGHLVDQPITKRPEPVSSLQAQMIIAAHPVEARGCVIHPPSTWASNPH
jgi:hypothetical protein